MEWWGYVSVNSNPSLTYLPLIEKIIKGDWAASTLPGDPQEEESKQQSAAEGQSWTEAGRRRLSEGPCGYPSPLADGLLHFPLVQ